MDEINSQHPVDVVGESPLGAELAVYMPGGFPMARYHNARVTIHYSNGQGITDTGTITYIDGNWVELTKDNSERLLVPVLAIRIVKLLEPPRASGEAASLLRPAGYPPGGQKGR